MTKQFIHNNILSRKRQTWCITYDDSSVGKALLYPQSVMQKNEFSNFIDFDNIESYLRGKGFTNVKKKSETEYLFAHKPICDYYKKISSMSEQFCDDFAEYVVGNKNLCSRHYEES